jgi:hypothetical protein
MTDKPKTCRWKRKEPWEYGNFWWQYGSYWETTCMDESVELAGPNPKFRFCPYCGRVIEVVKEKKYE